MPFVQSIKARNVLSFGPQGIDLGLRDLNVIIGANSSGKSNLISLLSLLQAAPTDITKPISAGGGILEWLWKGGPARPTAEMDIAIDAVQNRPWRYSLKFREEAQRFALVDERIENTSPDRQQADDVFWYYRYQGGSPAFSVVLTDEEEEVRATPGVAGSSSTRAPVAVPPRRRLRREQVQPNQSVLSQRRGPDQYPEITRLSDAFGRLAIFQDWEFGRNSPVRRPQSTDMPKDFLLEDASNLALVFEDMIFSGQASELRDYLQLASESFQTVRTKTHGGTIQLYLEEAGLASPTPSTRLSQGALQLLCLLAVLLNPHPPEVICLEEPEKGLHPDILPKLAEMLIAASQRCQLIVTTHSEILVDCFTETPESVIVCEKEDGESRMRRLSAEDLSEWLDDYRSLSKLWSKGVLGGNRY